jgi:phosphoketolase
MTNKHNQDNHENPSSVEFWRELGIEPIVVNTSNDEDTRQKAADVAERIKEAIENIEKEGKNV